MRKILLLSLALIAAASTYAQPTDWARYGRYEEQNAALAGRPVEVVFMGNSITDNWITVDPAFFAENKFVDRGISGQTTIEMLARMRRDVIDLRPRALVLMAGINDIAQNNGPIKLENTFGNIVSMCELAQHNGIRVVLCSVLPCERFGWRPELKPADKVSELNAMLKHYAAKNGIVYVDYHTAFATPSGGLSERFAADGCHPTLYGYSLMEPLVTEGINKALDSRKPRYVTPIPEK